MSLLGRALNKVSPKSLLSSFSVAHLKLGSVLDSAWKVDSRSFKSLAVFTSLFSRSEILSIHQQILASRENTYVDALSGAVFFNWEFTSSGRMSSRSSRTAKPSVSSSSCPLSSGESSRRRFEDGTSSEISRSRTLPDVPRLTPILVGGELISKRETQGPFKPHALRS